VLTAMAATMKCYHCPVNDVTGHAVMGRCQ